MKEIHEPYKHLNSPIRFNFSNTDYQFFVKLLRTLYFVIDLQCDKYADD